MKRTGKHILVIDDNQENLKLIAQNLRDASYLVSLAESGDQALQQLQVLIPDLILLDIMMPVIDGLELCRRIKSIENLKDIPVIFLTAKSRSVDIIEGFKAGGVDYITKPYVREELLVRISNHLKLSNALEKVKKMYQSQTKLYSIISHDLRTPLNGILQTIDAIEEDYLDPQSPEFIEILERLKDTTSSTGKMLDKLLDWSKSNDTSMPFSPDTTDLCPIIKDCILMQLRNSENKNISINHNLPEKLTAWIDDVSIQTVFHNIISNAIKFTPDNGSINIISRQENDRIIIEVRDTGIGMDEDAVAALLNSKEHFSTPGTNNEAGSGLGFFIIKDFLAKNHGKIKINSIKGTGTQLIVSLPLSEESIQ